MLIAKGKLKLPAIDNSSNKPKTQQAGQKKEEPIIAEIEINDVPISCRNLLTRGATQDEISKMSGAAISTRGRYMSYDDRAKNNMGERPLYLCVQGATQDTVDTAVRRIREIIANSMKPKGQKGSVGSITGSSGGGIASSVNNTPRPSLLPPPLMSLPSQPPSLTGGQHFIQEKVFVGLEYAHPSFNVRDKLLGPGGSFIQHIRTETGANVILRGKGSGYVEPISGREAFEPMYIYITHPKVEGLAAAKKLCENLIHTIHGEYAKFQSQIVAAAAPSGGLLPPPAQGIPAVVTVNAASAGISAVIPPPGIATHTVVGQPVAASPIVTPVSPTQHAMTAHPQSLGAVSVAASIPTLSVTQPVFQNVGGVGVAPTMTTIPQPAHTVLQQAAAVQQPHQLQTIQLQPQQQQQQAPQQVYTVQTSLPTSVVQQHSIGSVQTGAAVQAIHQPQIRHNQVQAQIQIQHQLQPQVQLQPQPQPQIQIPVSVGIRMPPTKESFNPQSQQQKRRFTEDPTQDDKAEDELLGYQHGPPHLTNLGAVPGVTSQASHIMQVQPPLPRATGQHMVQTALQLPQGVPQVSLDGRDSKLMPPPPIPINMSHTVPDKDKHLMPPPCLPMPGGRTRSPSPDEQQRQKRMKTSLVAYEGDSDEDDELSGGRQIQRNAAKYEHHHYQHKPLIYTSGGQSSPNSQYFPPSPTGSQYVNPSPVQIPTQMYTSSQPQPIPVSQHYTTTVYSQPQVPLSQYVQPNYSTSQNAYSSAPPQYQQQLQVQQQQSPVQAQPSPAAPVHHQPPIQQQPQQPSMPFWMAPN
ncbi:KH homology domain-containing protein 4-like isoform X2 [Ptychodera flava]